MFCHEKASFRSIDELIYIGIFLSVFLMFKTLVVCLHNWKEEAGNGRKATLFTWKVLLDEQNKGKILARRVSGVLLIEAPD